MKILILLIFFQSSLLNAHYVHVKIADQLQKVEMSGKDLTRTIKNHNKTKKFLGEKEITFDCNTQKKLAKSKELTASIQSSKPIIKWNGKKYLGSFLLHKEKNQSHCQLIHRVPMDNYLSTLLAKEMDKSWPIEALKAQAVAARTYAIYHAQISERENKPFHLENSEKFQVNGTVEDENYKTLSAAKSTSNEILVNQEGQIEPIFYHSKCGGKTLKPQEVWGGVMSSYASVDCPFCKNHGTSRWTHQIALSQFQNYIDKVSSTQSASQQIQVMKNQKYERLLRYYQQSHLKTIPKSQLRNKIGRQTFPSNNYQVTQKGSSITILGEGYGHGVGMCQFGAYELALRGYGYKEILSYYFPNHQLKKLKNND